MLAFGVLEIANVFKSINVPLSTETVTSVRAGSILSLVQVPEVAAGVDALALVGGQELIVVPGSHTTSDHLTDARHQDVNRLCNTLVVIGSLHVERLDFRGEVSEENRAVDFVGHLALGSFGTIQLCQHNAFSNQIGSRI